MRVLRIWSQSGGQLYIKAAKEGYLASARSMRRCARELLRVLMSTLPSSARCIQREAGLRRAPKWSVTWEVTPTAAAAPPPAIARHTRIQPCPPRKYAPACSMRPGCATCRL